MWYHRESIYQIFPRSFYDSNGDGVGDIRGIIHKLDYIEQMGFETIWISPFYKSPQRDFGYDVSDYCSIAEEYGTMADVEELIAEVHKRDMKIVFDIVMNHTSDQHSWFLESRSSRDNPKADWYIWAEKPNNWKSIVGPYGWHYCKERNQYYFASFFPFQPDLNFNNPEVKKAMFDVCRFWMKKGVDGFRLDIFNCIIKDEHLRDNPFSLIRIIPSPEYPGGNFQIRKYSLNQPGNFVLAKELRSVADEFPEPPRLLVGEVFGTHDIKLEYLGVNEDRLHLIFLFDILYFKFKASFFRKKILDYEYYYKKPNVPTVVFSNHDQPRSIRRIGNDMEKAKLLAMVQFTMRCVPIVYYGEEIGMTNGNILLKDAKDYLPSMFKWVPQFLANMLPATLNRDIARTPMQWGRSKNAGFSVADKTWLPVNDNIQGRTVEEQLNDPNSLLNVFKTLNHLRNNNAALHSGSIDIVKSSHADVLAYTRSYVEQNFLVLLNFSSSPVRYPLTVSIKEIIYSLHGAKLTPDACELPAYAGVILKI